MGIKTNNHENLKENFLCKTRHCLYSKKEYYVKCF